jgi:3-hydroxy-9,10-secoandrosta-1,3,5(10)-triene-9,17-dione monooxygenase reductase component
MDLVAVLLTRRDHIGHTFPLVPPLDPSTFRAALGSLPTGVTVVTAAGPDGPTGATANAVTSLSLDPPMMLACLDRGSRTLEAVRAAGHFGVNALAAGQEELAVRFSSKDPHPQKWRGVDWSESSGMPRIEGALLWVACELRDLIDGGDHLILTGHALEAEGAPDDPLIFHAGAYRPLD